jgi:hypothetical protein
MSLLTLLSNQGVTPTPQAVAGTLTMSGSLSTVTRFTVSLSGTLTMSGTTSTVYSPPSGGGSLLTLLRRNQTD